MEPQALAALSAAHPPLIHAQPPTTEDGLTEVFRFTILRGIPPYAQYPLFRPLTHHLEAAFASRIPASKLASAPDSARSLAELEQRTERARDAMVFIPYAGIYEQRILVFTPDGEWIGDLPPLPEPSTANQSRG